MTPLIKTLALMVVFSLICTVTAQAHKVTIFAWAEGNMIHTESKFSGGKVVKDGRVEVFDSEGDRLLEGRTSDSGEFSFKVPAIADLKIVLTAGMGHRNSWTVKAAELGEGVVEPAANHRVPSTAQDSPMRPKATPQDADRGLTAQAVEAIVSRQLEQKLQPLTRMLVAAQEGRPSVGDIFGGIGYIIGLVGLGAYLRFRKAHGGS